MGDGGESPALRAAGYGGALRPRRGSVGGGRARQRAGARGGPGDDEGRGPFFPEEGLQHRGPQQVHGRVRRPPRQQARRRGDPRGARQGAGDRAVLCAPRLAIRRRCGPPPRWRQLPEGQGLPLAPRERGGEGAARQEASRDALRQVGRGAPRDAPKFPRPPRQPRDGRSPGGDVCEGGFPQLELRGCLRPAVFCGQ